MFNKFYNSVFLVTLILGTLIAVSSSSWMMCWIGLEINLMSMIPLLLNKINESSTEASIKYFLSQAFASFLIILPGLYLNSYNLTNNFLDSMSLISMALGIKAGMAPTHFWFPQVIEMVQWTQALIILTWQKIAPMILMSFTLTNWTFVLIFMSAFTGMAGGFNQNSTKKIMAFSSVAHMAWMMSIVSYNEKIWWLYFLIYSSISISVLIPLSLLNVNSLNKMNTYTSKSHLKMMFMLNFISLAGLPPFLGIAPKILVVQTLMNSNNFPQLVLALILIVTSLITLFFYLRIFYTSIIMTNSYSLNSTNTFFAPSYGSNLLITSTLGNILVTPLVLYI